MTPLSSIFSFSTLKVRPWVSRTLILSLLLLVAAEAAARYAVEHHRLHVDAFARRLIEEHRADIAKHPGGTWLLGNSTLERGVNESLITDRTGLDIVKLPHGSATVSASALMIDYYMKTAAVPPRQIILFVGQDDLNLYGYRAEVSAEYETILKNPGRKPQEFLMLWQARAHIVEMGEEYFEDLLHRRIRRHGDAPLPKGIPEFDGKLDINDKGYAAHLPKYELNTAAVAAFAQAAHSHGVKDVAIVLIPCTDKYVAFHDHHAENESYTQFRADLAALCQKSGITFYDFGGPWNNYHEYEDPYHLNKRGAARFTNILVDAHVFAGARPSQPMADGPNRSASQAKSD
jgi:hypothetical protein